MILNCLKTKEPYVGPKSDCQISPIFLQFWWVLSYIFRLLSPIFLYFWTPKVLDTLCVYINHSIRATMITKLDKSGYEAQHIMAVSGHRNESSIRSYSSNKLEREEENVTDIIQITEQ